MNMNNKVKLYGIILGIVLFAFLILGFTYAWITWNSSNIAISGLTECLDIDYTTGQDIVNANVLLFDESKIINNNNITIKKGMAVTNVIASTSSNCTIDDVWLRISLDATSINDNYFTGDSVGAFKYAIARYDHTQHTNVSVDTLENISFEIIKNGSVTKSGESILVNDIKLSSEEIGILIIFYIDGDLAGNNIGNSTFSGTIIGSAMQGSSTLMEHIKNEYVSGNPTLITHNKDDGTSDTYYYSYQDGSKTWGLMNDGLKVADTFGSGATSITDTTKLISGTEGNIRYFGPSDKVNNYIYFNCDDYSDTSTCERWRIVGIIDGKVKIIRDEDIGGLAWDQDKNQDSNLTTYSNNWETSSLQLFLNGLYYDRGDVETHTYYSASGGVETELNLVNIGIKNDITREMISSTTWYLGGKSNSSVYPNEIYTYERTNMIGTTIRNGNPYTINANIGLMYVSDYGYGTDLTKCSYDIDEYDNSANLYACRKNNWLYNSEHQWLITPSGTAAYYYACYVNLNGFSDNTYVYHHYNHVRPVLYLDALVLKVGGDGSYDNPYLINSDNGNDTPVESPLQLGDYVSYTPIKTTYSTDPDMTGYSDVQTITPSELNLWRVLNKNEDGSVEIISEYVSSTDVYFSGQTGYLNFVGYLNTLAEQYETEGITVTNGSRHFGYNGQTEYLDSENVSFSDNILWESSTTDNSNETEGGGDILYEKDYNDVNTALGTRVAYRVNSITATSYWMASRYYYWFEDDFEFGFGWNGRNINMSDDYEEGRLYYYSSLSDRHVSDDSTSSLRPIVTLKPGLTFTGQGTSGSPWEIVS